MRTITKLGDFLNTPFRSFFSLWIPILFSMVAEPLTGLVDTAFVARLGTEPLAALGVGTVVLTGGLWLFNFLSVGSQTEVSQALGKQDLVKGRRIGSLALFLAIVIGTTLAFAGWFFSSPLASIMGASGRIHEHAVIYIQIRVLGAPAVLISMTSFGILYGLADMRSPLMIALAVNGLNILLDALLIFGLGPFPQMGIAGAALASSLSQWCGGLWCCFLVYRRIGFSGQIDLADVRKLLLIGRDMLLRTGALILFLLIATRTATRLGSEAGAAHQAIRQVWVFTSLFLDASAITAQTLIGYFYGSGRVSDARRVAGLVCQWSLLIGVFLLAVMISGKNLTAALLVPAASVSLFTSAWLVAAAFQPIAALAFVTDGIHWGTGDFFFLRNIVILATGLSVLAILAAETGGWASLTVVWLVTGGWVFIRSLFGMLRIWPGLWRSPLRLQRD